MGVACSWTAAVRPVRWTTSTVSGSTTPSTLRACLFLRRVVSCSMMILGTSSSRMFIDVNSTLFSTRSVSAIHSSHRYAPPPALGQSSVSAVGGKGGGGKLSAGILYVHERKRPNLFTFLLPFPNSLSYHYYCSRATFLT